MRRVEEQSSIQGSWTKVWAVHKAKLYQTLFANEPQSPFTSGIADNSASRVGVDSVRVTKWPKVVAQNCSFPSLDILDLRNPGEQYLFLVAFKCPETGSLGRNRADCEVRFVPDNDEFTTAVLNLGPRPLSCIVFLLHCLTATVSSFWRSWDKNTVKGTQTFGPFWEQEVQEILALNVVAWRCSEFSTTCDESLSQMEQLHWCLWKLLSPQNRCLEKIFQCTSLTASLFCSLKGPSHIFNAY